MKAFGYPEFFVPAHHLPTPLPEGALVTPATHPSLLAAATAFITRLVERYRDRDSIAAWQVEQEAVDPLGVEHSWRLATPFVAEEVAAVREADANRPIMMNGFLPSTLPVPSVPARTLIEPPRILPVSVTSPFESACTAPCANTPPPSTAPS